MKQDWNKTDDCTQNSASPPLQRARLCVCTWVLCMSSARSHRRQCILQLIQLQIFTLPRGRQWCSCQPMSVSVCCCRFRGKRQTTHLNLWGCIHNKCGAESECFTLWQRLFTLHSSAHLLIFAHLWLCYSSLHSFSVLRHLAASIRTKSVSPKKSIQ